MKLKLHLLLFLFYFSFSNAQTFSGSTGAVSDDGQINDFTATVSGLFAPNLNASLGLVQVCLNITHTYDSDLNVFLIAPDGTTVNLFSGVGGGGHNFTNTCLNQSATTAINSGNAPFNGTYKPQETLGNFNNFQNGNGIWKLRIIDTYPADVGTVNSWNITFGSNAAVPFIFNTSNLPIVIINTGNTPIPDDPAIGGTMGIIDNGVGMTNHTTDVPNNYNGKITIELRGAYSQSLPQKPYKIETVDDVAAELDVSLLGMPEEHDWCLIANYNDKVFMRNTLAYKLASEMGNYAARSKFCEVVVNGNYQGIYMLMESIKRDNNRVDIAKLETTENTGINLTGGYIIKNDYWDSSNSWLLSHHPIDHPELNVHLVYDYPKPQNITPQQQTYIQTFINDFENTLYSADYADANIGYNKYINTTSFIDYFIINELSRNNDGFKKSCYFNKDKDSDTEIAKLNAGPVWDFDWAWKNINECSIFSATNGSGWAHHINDCVPDVNSPGWYIRLLQDPNFQNKLRCRWDSLRTTILSAAYLNNYIDTTAGYLNEAQARHFEKWGNLGLNTGAPEVEPDPSTFTGEITKFKNWISLRLAWLDANIPGSSVDCNLAVASPKTKNNWTIFPNPAKDNIVIIATSELLQSIEIFDITGKSVLKQNKSSEHMMVNISELSDGIYICKIVDSDSNISMQKITVMH